MKLIERVTQVESVIPAIHNELKRLNDTMEGLDHVIRGNGSPGLVERVGTIVSKIENLEGTRNRWRDAFFTVGGGVIVGVAVFLFSNQWSSNHDLHHDLPAMQQKP